MCTTSWAQVCVTCYFYCLLHVVLYLFYVHKRVGSDEAGQAMTDEELWEGVHDVMGACS
jgi:hypothetical protein